MKNVAQYYCRFKPVVLLFFLLLTCCVSINKEREDTKNYYVAAYVWPSCHNDTIAQEYLWSEGIGEWEIIQKGTPRFQGHYQPREPLWGYLMDDDPLVWEKKIDTATEYHVNTFIFDWYWYDGKPFLEGSVNAFLKASNSKKMNFYLMWANHDVPGSMWNPYRYTNDSILWNGTVDWNNFMIIVDRVIQQYFKQSNYFTIEGMPVFSVYQTENLIKSFGSMTETRKALDYFREKTVEAGFPGLHIQLVGSGTPDKLGYWGGDFDVNEVIRELDINSITMYNMSGATSRKEDYIRYGEDAAKVREKWNETIQIPFFPCVSVGWDDTPRYPDKGKEDVVHLYNTPQNFAKFLYEAKTYADNHPDQPPLIVINAWNEWVEGSYLEPDKYLGYGFLEAVKEIMEGNN